MIIADFECQNKRCKRLEADVLIESHVWYKTCRHCGHDAKRIISLGRVNMVNEDARHIRESAAALLDMEVARKSKDPIERALAESPTRSNLKAYLKHKNLRYAENEKGAPPIYRPKPELDMTKARNEAWERHRERNRLEIRT